jgi:stage IV sporulation protein FB
MGGFHLFTLAEIPIWISPWFLIIPLYAVQALGFTRGAALSACVLFSVLVHELGHALLARHYHLGPNIVVHGLGGHTTHQRPRTRAQNALIVAAGPAFGLVLGALSLAVLIAVLPAQARTPDALWSITKAGISQREVPPLLGILGEMVWCNVLWSLVNALPLWPLDGGRLFQLGISTLVKPLAAERITHSVALLGYGALALLLSAFPGVLSASPIALLLLAMLAFPNLQGLLSSGKPVRRDNPFARQLMAVAETAHAQGDDEQAARLCQQIRAETGVPPSILARTWAMLGVIATRKGEYEEALSYLRRAPDAADVVEATAQCFYQLEMYEALTALTETRAFGKLPSETREQILRALHEATVV